MGGKAVQHHGRRMPGQRLGPAGIPGAAGVQLQQQGSVVLLILRERREKVLFADAQVQVRIARDAAGQLREQRLNGLRLHGFCLQGLGAHARPAVQAGKFLQLRRDLQLFSALRAYAPDHIRHCDSSR